MSKRPCAAGLLLLIAIGSADISMACGDEFLVSSRGTRFQRAAVAREPASILIYANPASELPKLLAGVAVDATLIKAGYRPTTVATSDEFDKALSRGGGDLVLVGMADAQRVSKGLRGDHAPAVLPVVFNPTISQLEETRRLYRVMLKAPANGRV